KNAKLGTANEFAAFFVGRNESVRTRRSPSPRPSPCGRGSDSLPTFDYPSRGRSVLPLPKGEGRGEGEENGQIGSDFASTKTVASEKRQKTGAVQDVAENSLPHQYEEASSFHDLLANPSEEDSGSSFAEADAAEPSQVSEARPQPADRARPD